MLNIKNTAILFCFGLLYLSSFAFADATTPVEPAEAPAVPVEPVAAPSLKEALKKSSEANVLEQEAELLLLGPLDEFNRGTPRGSVLGLKKALERKDYKRAINYFDFRNLPFSMDEEGVKEGLVRKLLIIAKQTFHLDLSTLSTDSGGHSDDGLPTYRDRLARINTPNGDVDLLMQHVPRGDGVSIWKISNATVAIIPDLYEHFGYGEIGDAMADMFPVYVFMGLETWQWIALIGVVIVAAAFAWLLTVLVNIPLRRKKLFHTATFIAGPVRFLIIVLLIRASFDSVSPSLTARAFFEAGTMYIAAVTWVIMGIVDIFVGRLTDRLQRTGQLESKILLRPATTVVKIIIIAFAVLAWLDNIGYEVTTLIAGLGVGSIAIALAAQKSLENIIGAVTIYASKTIRIGDFCRYKDIIGTVEEIGLRCTVLRTLERSIVHIPNGALANDKVENLSLRDKILYRSNIRLRYETTPDQLRCILVEIRQMLYAHPKVDEEAARVRFKEFGDSSMKIEIYAYIKTTAYSEYLEVREDLNLRIMDIVTEAGTQLAIPANVTYITREQGPDEARTQEAEAKVAQWRDSETLYMTKPPAEKIRELKGTLDYPYKSTPTPK